MGDLKWVMRKKKKKKKKLGKRNNIKKRRKRGEIYVIENTKESALMTSLQTNDP